MLALWNFAASLRNGNLITYPFGQSRERRLSSVSISKPSGFCRISPFSRPAWLRYGSPWPPSLLSRRYAQQRNGQVIYAWFLNRFDLIVQAFHETTAETVSKVPNLLDILAFSFYTVIMTKSFTMPMVLALAAVLIAGCFQRDLISGTGTVKFIYLEAGFYGIIGDNGEHYYPTNLNQGFEVDGLRVRFEAEIRDDVVGIHMWGTPIKLLKIDLL